MGSFKKGVSPLIATVLLVSFTIAIGAFLSGWIQELTAEQSGTAAEQARPECTQASFNSYDEKFSSGVLSFRLKNTGLNTITITKVQIIYDDSTIVNACLDAKTIGVNEYSSFSMNSAGSSCSSSISSNIEGINVISDCPGKAITIKCDEISPPLC